MTICEREAIITFVAAYRTGVEKNILTAARVCDKTVVFLTLFAFLAPTPPATRRIAGANVSGRRPRAE